MKNEFHVTPELPLLLDLSNGRIEAHFDSRQSPINKDFFHTHPHYELLYIVKGTRELIMNNANCKAEAGDLILFRPGDIHVEYAGSRRISYFVFRFTQKELADSDLKFPGVDGLGPVISIPRHEEFYDMFTRMLHEFKNPDEESNLLLGAYLLEFVIKFKRAVNTMINSKNPSSFDATEIRVSKAMDIMNKNIHTDIDLKELASRVFMSASHFSHAFKDKTGESPKRYIIKERIRKAKELLKSSGKTAVEISEELGYESPYFFYRQFQKETGLTARQYRESVKKVHKK